jgi:hypothetical protein
MILDDTQRQHVQEWLITHSANHRIPDCSFCQGNAGQWEYRLYTPIAAGNRTRFGMSPSWTQVELACATCGYLIGFNAALLGLADPFFEAPTEATNQPPE